MLTHTTLTPPTPPHLTLIPPPPTPNPNALNPPPHPNLKVWTSLCGMKHLKHCKELLNGLYPYVYIYIYTQCVLPNLFHEPNWRHCFIWTNYYSQIWNKLILGYSPHNLSWGLCEVVVIYPNFFRFNPVLPARIPSNPSEKRTFSSEPFQIPLSNLITPIKSH